MESGVCVRLTYRLSGRPILAVDAPAAPLALARLPLLTGLGGRWLFQGAHWKGAAFIILAREPPVSTFCRLADPEPICWALRAVAGGDGGIRTPPLIP